MIANDRKQGATDRKFSISYVLFAMVDDDRLMIGDERKRYFHLRNRVWDWAIVNSLRPFPTVATLLCVYGNQAFAIAASLQYETSQFDVL